MFENWSIHDPELIPLTELSKVQDPMGTLFGMIFYNANDRNLDFCIK